MGPPKILKRLVNDEFTRLYSIKNAQNRERLMWNLMTLKQTHKI